MLWLIRSAANRCHALSILKSPQCPNQRAESKVTVYLLEVERPIGFDAQSEPDIQDWTKLTSSSVRFFATAS